MAVMTHLDMAVRGRTARDLLPHLAYLMTIAGPHQLGPR